LHSYIASIETVPEVFKRTYLSLVSHNAWNGFSAMLSASGGIPRTGNLSGNMLHVGVFHWLPFQQRIIFRIATLVWRRLLGLALTYICTCQIIAVPPWSPEVAVPSALWNEGLFVPFARTSTSRPLHCRWFALLCGLNFRWRSDCSPWFTLYTFYSKTA